MKVHSPPKMTNADSRYSITVLLHSHKPEGICLLLVQEVQPRTYHLKGSMSEPRAPSLPCPSPCTQLGRGQVFGPGFALCGRAVFSPHPRNSIGARAGYSVDTGEHFLPLGQLSVRCLLALSRCAIGVDARRKPTGLSKAERSTDCSKRRKVNMNTSCIDLPCVRIYPPLARSGPLHLIIEVPPSDWPYSRGCGGMDLEARPGDPWRLRSW